VVLLDNKSSILRKVSACPRVPKAVLFRLAKFLLEALTGDGTTVVNGQDSGLYTVSWGLIFVCF